jgi:hypothetical protein
MISATTDWLIQAPVWLVGAALFALALAVAFLSHLARLRSDRARTTKTSEASDTQEGYIVSSVLALLALILGFTLVMAVDRFDARRVLVLEEANAIGTTYLRVQLLGEPHRTRLSKLLIDYTENKMILAQAQRDDGRKLLADNDRMLTELWSATAAAFDSVATLDFSTALLETTNRVIDLDAGRKAARLARVPVAVLVLLTIYILITAGVLGYVLVGFRRQLAGSFLMLLLTSWLMLIVDLERPTTGAIRESQRPMELLSASFKKQPPQVFDRWRTARE